MNTLHVPTSGMFCVPTAIELITGEDPHSRIFPSLNRHDGADTLLDPVGGIDMSSARKTLEELGYLVRAYKGKRGLQAMIRDWAKRFPDHTVLVAAAHHCLVLRGGHVYDSWYPLGLPANEHPFATARVKWAALVQRRNT